MMKEDILYSFPECKKPRQVDYVTGWYIKAAKCIKSYPIEVAFVSTNSITQGQQVALLWEELFKKYQIQINFAYQTFIWSHETRDQGK